MAGMPSSSIVSFTLALLLFAGAAAAQTTCEQTQKTWCVAKPSADEAALNSNLAYVFDNADCSLLQRNCADFNNLSLISRASLAMNLYYQTYGRNIWNCVFISTALITTTDPSFEGCLYA